MTGEQEDVPDRSNDLRVRAIDPFRPAVQIASAEARMPDVRVGMVNAPAVSDELTAWLVDDIRGELEARFPHVRWTSQLLKDGLVEPPADDSEIVAAARQLLLRRAWDLVVVLTDLPVRGARRPVVAQASPVHGVAVLSVPALGTLAVRRRLRAAVLRLIGALLGETGDDGARERLMPSCSSDRRPMTARR